MATFKLLDCLFKNTDKNFTCQICFEKLPHDKKFHTKKCCHSYCKECMSLYVEASVHDNKSKIKCPSPKCKKILDALKCRSIVKHDVFLRWCDNLCNHTLLSLNVVYCPYTDCSAPVIGDCGYFVSKVNCPQCKRNFCLWCKTQWHEGLECQEVDKNLSLLSKTAMRLSWVRCPTCNHGIMRESGCDNIKCRCGEQFCYRCGKQGGHGFGKCKQWNINDFQQKSWAAKTQ